MQPPICPEHNQRMTLIESEKVGWVYVCPILSCQKAERVEEVMPSAKERTTNLDTREAREGCQARNKYGAKRTQVDGTTFDSQKEAARYEALKLRQKAGEIAALSLQPAFPLKGENGVILCEYRADFLYLEKGQWIVEDVKSEATKTRQYRLKKKWLREQYGIGVKET